MYSYGRIESPDERDRYYDVEDVLPEGIPPITKRFWWDNAWWGNQWQSSMCVAFSWTHWVEDGPVIQDRIVGREKPFMDPSDFYHTCQMIDQWPGTNYNGTSVRAGAKVLKHLGIIREYRWAFRFKTIVKTLLTLGPMVVGTKWYAGMERPNRRGALDISGSERGSHAYVINGVDTEHEFFRIKNSWGKSWGDGGHGYIRFHDFRTLMLRGSTEACIASEIKMSKIPTKEDLQEVVSKYHRY